MQTLPIDVVITHEASFQQESTKKELNKTERKTTDAAQQQLATQKEEAEKSPSPPIKKGHASDLRAHVNNFSSDIEGKFETTLRHRQFVIAGFHSLFNSSNKRYNGDATQMHLPEMREKYNRLREEEKAQHEKILTSYEKLKKFSSDRLAALDTAIRKLMHEAALIKETIAGNDSYFKSFSILKFEMGYRYGIAFRLWELNEAIERRRLAIGIQPAEVPVPESSEIAVIRPSKFAQDLAKLLGDIDVLKEVVTVCNKTFEKEPYVENNEWVRKYYIFHRQCLDELRASIQAVQESKAQHIEQLEKSINDESNASDSLQSIADKKELIEIKMCLEKIAEREAEIEAFLHQRKSYFKLAEAGLDTKDPMQLEDLSPEYQQANALLGRITRIKEEILLTNGSEHLAPLSERRVIYFQFAKQAADLNREKLEFETSTMTQRLKTIEDTVRTYGSWMNNLQETLQASEIHLQLLNKDAQERVNWQVTPPKEAAPSILQQEKKGGLFSWWRSSSTQVEEQAASTPSSENGVSTTSEDASLSKDGQDKGKELEIETKE